MIPADQTPLAAVPQAPQLPAVIPAQTAARGSLEEAQQPAKSLASLKRMFDDWQWLTQDNRSQALVHEDYFNCVQWTAEERRVLRARKQPDNVFNRVRPAILGTLGIIKQATTLPICKPSEPDDQDSADVANKALVFAAKKSRFANLKVEVSENYFVNGTGAVIIEVDQNHNISPRRIRWEEFFYDPRSRERDFSDARYKGIAKWMYADDVQARYPKSDVESVLSGGAPTMIDQSLQDRPLAGSTAWVDSRRRRLLLCEVYYTEGGIWYWAVFHGGAVLEQGVSPYNDTEGKPDCPIEAQTCYVDRDNNRYGLIRDMIGPQDEINKRRSKLLHLINSRQVQENQPGSLMGMDADEVRKEAARPDGVLPSGVQVIQTTDMAQGQVQMLQYATAEIERMGPNPAILGRQGADASGRQTLLRQQAGLTEQAVVLGGIEEWELRCYRQMWARMKQYWQAPDWIRVTDDQAAPGTLGVSPEQQDYEQRIGMVRNGKHAFLPLNQPIYGPPMQGLQQHPQTGAMVPAMVTPILGYRNSIAEMDVDIDLDVTPDVSNVQQEQFQALVDLARSGVPIPPQVLIEASTIPNKREIIAKLEQMQQQSASAPPPPQAVLALKKGEAEVGKIQAQGQLAHAQAIQAYVEAGQTLNPPSPEPGWSDGPQMPPQGVAGAPGLPALPPPAGGQPNSLGPPPRPPDFAPG